MDANKYEYRVTTPFEKIIYYKIEDVLDFVRLGIRQFQEITIKRQKAGVEVKDSLAAVWHKVSDELPPVDTEVVCKMKGVPHTEHFVCKWDGKYWVYWAYFRNDIQGWFGLNPEWEVTEWKEI